MINNGTVFRNASQGASTSLADHSFRPSNRDVISLSQLWRIVVRRRTLAIAIVLVFVVMGALYCLVAHRKYDAVGTVALNMDNANVLGLDMAGMGGSSGLDQPLKLETQVNVLASDQLAWKVIAQLKLDREEMFISGFAKENAPIDYRSPDPLVRATILAVFRKNLSVQSLPHTLIIRVRYRCRDPRLAAKVVNALIDAYTEQNFQSRYRATVQASDWLMSQLDDLKQHMESAQKALADYQEEHGILGALRSGGGRSGQGQESNDVNSNILDQMAELNRDLVTATTDRIAKEALYRQAQAGGPEQVGGGGWLSGAGLGNLANLVADLHQRRSVLQTQLAQLNTTYLPNFPQVVQTRNQLAEVDRQIEDEDRRIVEELRKAYDSSSRAEGMLRAKLDDLTSQAFKLNRVALQFSVMQQEADSNRDLYTALLAKVKEAGVTAGLRATDISVVDYASVPVLPSAPNVPLLMGVAILGGLLVAFGAATFVENLDHSVTQPEDAENVMSVPLIGVIPNYEPAAEEERRRIASEALQPKQIATEAAVLASPRSSIAEAFRSMRTSILLSSSKPPQLILVTSSLPGEGKSFVSMNTAAALADSGARVLLLDADLRRPSIARKLGIARDLRGLTSVIAGQAPSAELVKKYPELPTLDVLASGYASPRPAEMLGSERMKELIAEWRAEYDYIVVDSPPVLAVTDPVILAHQADAVLMVARAQRTNCRSLQRAREVLERARVDVFGVVVNDFNPKSANYYEYYGYEAKSYAHYYTADGISK